MLQLKKKKINLLYIYIQQLIMKIGIITLYNIVKNILYWIYYIICKLKNLQYILIKIMKFLLYIPIVPI